MKETNLQNNTENKNEQKYGKEEKIIKYDAGTGETTIVDMDELIKKNRLLGKIITDSVVSIAPYNPISLNNPNANDIIKSENNKGIFEPDFTKVTDTSKFPYRVTCRMIINSGFDYGSGFLVGPNIMLTAAHTIYDEENNNEIRQFMVYPGYNDGAYKDCRSGWKTIYRSSIWLETHDREYDWALVELTEDLGNKLGWYGTRTYASNSSLEDVAVNLMGYPESLDSARYQYYTSGKISEVFDRHFICSVGNKGGMSGGPIALDSDNYAIGLISGNITGFFNDSTYGVKLNSYLMELIADYINNN